MQAASYQTSVSMASKPDVKDCTSTCSSEVPLHSPTSAEATLYVHVCEPGPTCIIRAWVSQGLATEKRLYEQVKVVCINHTKPLSCHEQLKVSIY